MKTLVPLMEDWKGMAPDNPREAMSKGQVWRMEDYIPRLLGSQLESRQGWAYHVSAPLDNYVTAQLWVNTLGGSHHLAATPSTLYNLDVPTAPRVVTSVPGALWPMATLYEYVLVPCTGDQLPVVLRYASGTEAVVTTHSSTPKAKIAITWQGRFVLANTVANSNRVFFLRPDWGAGLTTTPDWDTKSWWDTSADVMALAATRTSMLVFHEGLVERLRGTKPPAQGVEDDLWLEPLIGLGGCNEPHTICYWNDNVVFADARGVYLTDGTTIRDITTQGGIGREWRRAYDPVWRVSAGVVYDQYVIAMADVTNKIFKKCFVCDLYSRNWSVFNNMPFSSFVASVGEIERLFGGGLDGRVANLSPIWDEADPATDTVDANDIPVLPQLETAWLQMSENMQMKRIKNIFFAFDLSEATGQVKVYGCKQVQPESPADWILLKTLEEGQLLNDRGEVTDPQGIRRRRITVGREVYGMSFKVETTGRLRKLKLHDLSAELLPAREESYAGRTVGA